jgi:pyridoxamine 5'-phosphate oxidase
MTTTGADPELIRQLRQEYRRAGLIEDEAADEPFAQFARWFGEAVRGELREPNAMTVATATPDGVPSARIVLLKSWDERGFVFYTNYESHKGSEIAANPVAALVFYWPELERQVRIVGAVSRTTAEESRAYFASRPVGSRFGSIVSRQSRGAPETIEFWQGRPSRLHDRLRYRREADVAWVRERLSP